MFGKNAQTTPWTLLTYCLWKQRIVGTLFYYSHAMDSTLAAAIDSIATCKTNETENVLLACHQLLDYVATHSNATICFLVSDMVLEVHSHASYLSEFGG